MNTMRSVCFVIVLGLVLPHSLLAADSLTVTFRYDETPKSSIRAFVPGEFNNWGPNNAGVIAAGAPSQMEYNSGGGYWYKQVRLQVGSTYLYKFHLHLDATGNAYQWLPDPLNPQTDGSQYSNSVLAVAAPMIFEPSVNRDANGYPRKILASIFSSAAISKVLLSIDADTIDVTPSYDPFKGVLSYVPLSDILPTKQLVLTTRDALGRLGSFVFPKPVTGKRKLDVTFLFHANQNLVPAGKVGDYACFHGVVQTLRKHPALKFQIHISATTMHDMLWFGDSTLGLVRDGIRDGQFEIFGSAYAQNVMYSTRTNPLDFEFNDHQIKAQKELIQKVWGITPKAFWNPERVWTQNFVQLLADNGYRYIPVEDHILQKSNIPAPLYQPRVTKYNGRQLTVFEDGKQFLSLVDDAVNTGNITQVIDFLHQKFVQDVNDQFIIGYYQDMEATGLWDFEKNIDPQTNFTNLNALLTALEKDTEVNVTTYEDFLKNNPAPPELTPIADGAADWMGRDAWFTENQSSEFQAMRAIYDTLRIYVDSVAHEASLAPGNTAAAALVRHAWFTLVAHQFEFGCHGLQGDYYYTQLQLARTCAVSAAAGRAALQPATRAYWADVNHDGVLEVVLTTPSDFFVFSTTGGRLLYWFDLTKGEELVGNENFMADYRETYVNDNVPVPLLRGGIETYPWLAGNTILPEVKQWTYIVRKRGLNDVLTVGAAAPLSLEGVPYAVAINGTTIVFTTTSNGIRLRKTLSPDATGLRVSYRLVSNLGATSVVGLEIHNSFSPSYRDLMDNGRKTIAYWNGGTTYAQTPSLASQGVINTATHSYVRYAWDTPPDLLGGAEDVLALELNPSFLPTLNPGDSTGYAFTLQCREPVTAAGLPSNDVPSLFGLEQNYPNPFNPSTTIGFRIAEFGFVRLQVFDLLGREVAVLVNEEKHPGYYVARFDASGLASAVYLYRLTAGLSSASRKLVLMK